MIIPDWGNTCYSSLLDFYDVEGEKDGLALLRPKSLKGLIEIRERGFTYNWCWGWGQGSKVVKREKSPSSTAGVMKVFMEHVGCKDFESSFFCENGEEGERVNCLSCFAAFMAITKRGHFVEEGVKKAIASAKEFEKEL